MKSNVALLFALLAASRADASEWYTDKGQGWHWYHDPPALVEPPRPEPAPQVQSGANAPEVLSAAWFRANMDRYRDLAIDKPTTSNVRLYKLLERVAMDKASAFARQSELLGFSDALLDESASRPLNTLGAQVANAEASTGKAAAMRSIGRAAGVWFFYSHDCPYCEAQAPILEALAAAYNLTVLPVSLDGLPLDSGHLPNYVTDSGQAERLGVSVTPTMFLVSPDGDVRAVARGLVAQDEFEQRAVMTAASAGWISEQEYLDALPVRSDPAQESVLAEAGGGASNPTQEVLALLAAVGPLQPGEVASAERATPVLIRRP